MLVKESAEHTRASFCPMARIDVRRQLDVHDEVCTVSRRAENAASLPCLVEWAFVQLDVPLGH